MSDSSAAVLVVGAIAYLGGAVVLGAVLARALDAWTADLRPPHRCPRGRRHRPIPASDGPPGALADGVVDELENELENRAAEAVAAVAALAHVTPPATAVVSILGAPTHLASRGGGHVVGDGGLAVTRIKLTGRPTVVFAQGALTGLSPAAVRSLAAHELAHCIGHDRRSAAGRYGWLIGYVLLMLSGAALTVTALLTAPELAAPAFLATVAAAVAILGVRVAVDRREEIAADLFAITLTRDIDAAAELLRFTENHVARPVPAGRIGRAWSRGEQRWLAIHPDPQARLAAMRRHLVDQPE